MEQQNKKKHLKWIGGSALLLLSIGAYSFYGLTQQNNQQTQVAVEETTKQVVEVEVENKSTKETPAPKPQEEAVNKVVELSTQSVSEETVNTIIAVAEAKLTQPEELDKIVTLIEKPTTELDKVVGFVDKDDKKQDIVAVLPTLEKLIEKEKPTVSSDDNNKPTTPTEPGTPSGDTTPVQPGTPSGDTTPVQPGTPSGDTTPTEPGTPSGDTTPVQPTEPVTPVEPTTPVQPTEPVTPVEPITPEEPTKPVKPSEELSEDEKQLDIKTKVVDGKEVKYAVGEATTTEALPELDISKLTAEPTTNHLNQ